MNNIVENQPPYDKDLFDIYIGSQKVYGFLQDKIFEYDSLKNTYTFYLEATSGFNVVLLASSNTNITLHVEYKGKNKLYLPSIYGELSYKFIVGDTVPYYEYKVRGF